MTGYLDGDHTRLRTARKHHQCQACGWPVYPGERYVSVRFRPWDHPDNEGFGRGAYCRFCFESKDFADEDGLYPCFGMDDWWWYFTQKWWMEAADENYSMDVWNRAEKVARFVADERRLEWERIKLLH